MNETVYKNVLKLIFSSSGQSTKTQAAAILSASLIDVLNADINWPLFKFSPIKIFTPSSLQTVLWVLKMSGVENSSLVVQEILWQEVSGQLRKS